jgi:hypothetical protein
VVWIDVCTPPCHDIYDVRKESSFDQAVIDLVEGVSIWVVPGLEVDSIVHEVRIFDRHLPACRQSRPVWGHFYLYSHLMQAVLAYRWLMYGFPANFCVCVSHHQLHVMTWVGCVCHLQLFIKLILYLKNWLPDGSRRPHSRVTTVSW